MVIIEPYPPYNKWPVYPNYDPNPYPFEWTHPKENIQEKHIKEVKKGIMIKFEDGTWMFMATDDECYIKISEALNDKI